MTKMKLKIRVRFYVGWYVVGNAVVRKTCYGRKTEMIYAYTKKDLRRNSPIGGQKTFCTNKHSCSDEQQDALCLRDGRSRALNISCFRFSCLLLTYCAAVCAYLVSRRIPFLVCTYRGRWERSMTCSTSHKRLNFALISINFTRRFFRAEAPRNAQVEAGAHALACHISGTISTRATAATIDKREKNHVKAYEYFCILYFS